MHTSSTMQRNIGFLTFFISGICAISSGVVVSLLQEYYGFEYGMTGTLLSFMSIGNLMAGFAAGILPSRLGLKKTVVLLTLGYAAGYLLMGISGWIILLMLAFFLVGIAKGCTLNICTVLIKNNTSNSTKGMNTMHSCYALGALLCPFAIAAAAAASPLLPMFVLAFAGFLLWGAFAAVPMDNQGTQKGTTTDWSFLKSSKFWILTGLLFCQNAAETSVTGWMVTYFKGSGLLTGLFSTYTVTVMWGATLIARLLIAFVFPVKNAASSMIKMGIGCIIFYAGLMMVNSQIAAVLLLFAFAFSMAGMNPTAVASAGRMTSVTSMGVMLPVASSGAILMPWLIGIIAQYSSIHTGMFSNIVPCLGMLLFSIALKRLERQHASAVRSSQ